MNKTERQLLILAKAGWWEAMSLDQQKQYLKDHPRSKRKLTSVDKEKTKTNEDISIPSPENLFSKEGKEKYEEADKALTKEWPAEKFSKEDRFELESYCGWAAPNRAPYHALNSYLKHGEAALEDDHVKYYHEHIDDTIKGLDKVLDSKHTDTPFVSYRGIQVKPGAFRKGGTYKMANYASTSIDPEVGAKFAKNGWVKKGTKPCVMCFLVPKGAKGVYVGNIARKEHEKEFLMPRNTSYKVIGKTEKDGVWYIHAKILKD